MSFRMPLGLLRRSPGVTRGRTHVRDAMSVRGLHATIGIALLPAALAAVLNTGYQANAGMARLGADAPQGWRVGWLEAVGIAPEAGGLVASLAHGALYLLPALGVAWLAGAAWEHVFARVRRRERTHGLLPTALLFVLLLPPGAPLWHIALGMSLGTVMAKELFGGTGMGFMHPAAVGVALLALTYPTGTQDMALWGGLRGYTGTTVFNDMAAGGAAALPGVGVTWGDAFLGREPGAMGVTSALACGLGALVLLARGAASWRVLAGVLVGSGAAVLLCGPGGLSSSPVAALGWHWHLVLGGLAFAGVFLATDPATTAMTHPGRWVVGGLVGFLVVVIRTTNPLHPDGIVFAVLFANVAAPLVDAAVAQRNVRRRRRRHA